MKTKTVPLCEACGKEILAEAEGVIVQGNIYPMDQTREPIVGGAFAALPDELFPGARVDGEGNPTGVRASEFIARIEQFAFHRRCFVQALGVSLPAPRPGGRDQPGAFQAPLPAVGGTMIEGPVVGEGNQPRYIDEPGVPTMGDSVRLIEGHPDFSRFAGRALTVSRYREGEQDFVLYSADGQPVLAPARTVVRVRQAG